MLENVKNLVSHDKKNTFLIIREALDELDYNVHFRVLDGKHFVQPNLSAKLDNVETA